MKRITLTLVLGFMAQPGIAQTRQVYMLTDSKGVTQYSDRILMGGKVFNVKTGKIPTPVVFEIDQIDALEKKTEQKTEKGVDETASCMVAQKNIEVLNNPQSKPLTAEKTVMTDAQRAEALKTAQKDAEINCH